MSFACAVVLTREVPSHFPWYKVVADPERRLVAQDGWEHQARCMTALAARPCPGAHGCRWRAQVPALDNGEWLWSMYAMRAVLGRRCWHDLESAYDGHIRRALQYARLVFFSRAEPAWRAVTLISNASLPCVWVRECECARAFECARASARVRGMVFENVSSF